MLIMLRLRQQGALLKMGKTVTPFTGEAENDNDQVPKVPIIVKSQLEMFQNRRKNHEHLKYLNHRWFLLCQHSADHYITVPHLTIMGLGLSEGECSVGSIGQW